MTAWYDREILAGEDFDKEIARELAACDVFIAIVSPDFLSSNYCYEREMQQAIERQKRAELIIVPIIVEPCEWQRSPLGKFKAIPKDGKPISEWLNQNTAFLDVVTELRRLLSKRAGQSESKATGPRPDPLDAHPAQVHTIAGRTKYRVQRDFDEIDRSDFVAGAYAEIRDHFERSIVEIDSIEGLRGRFRALSETGFSCTILNTMRRGSAAHVTIHASMQGRTGFGLGDIIYSFQENAPPNTANGWLEVATDNYDLLLKANSFGEDKQEGMTADEAARWLWEVFLEQAGIAK